MTAKKPAAPKVKPAAQAAGGQDALFAALEDSAVLAAALDKSLVITRVNRAFFMLTGRDAAALVGQRLDSLIPPDKRDVSVREVRRAVMQGRGWANEELSLTAADGSVRTLLWSGTPAAEGFFAVGQDITEYKKVAQIKDDFIGMVSHEMRTPLTVVSSAINTAREERLSVQETRQLMAAAESSAASLASILDNLLELARYKAERLALEKRPTDVLAVTQQTLEKVYRQYPDRRAAVEIPPDLPPAFIDPGRLERVIYNLVENSFKYSPRESAVRVFARQEPDGLLFGVADSGDGMSEETAARLFEPFERAGAAKTRKGVGLGLLVCRRLVEAHGGKIWVESGAGKGTAFYFTVPAEKRPAR